MREFITSVQKPGEKKTLGRLIEATIRFGLPAHMEGKDFR